MSDAYGNAHARSAVQHEGTGNQTDLFVYGLGRSGTAVVRRAMRDGASVCFYDARETGPDVDEAMSLGAKRIRRVDELDTASFRTCVAAPGVRIDHPDLCGCETWACT